MRIFVLMRILLTLSWLLLLRPALCQDFTWWNELHGWDGVTHWARYMTYTPGMMGPNALPTPPLERGRIDSLGSLALAARGHFAQGDRTLDAHATLHLPLAGGRVAFGLDWMMWEHYRMDSTVRDMRRARDFDGKGWSTGDVNLNTLVQLVPEHEGRVGLLLRLRLRTASGNGREGARHTDAPGYSFDLSAGRWHVLEKPWLKRVRPHATLGFLVYQTNRDDYPQNDGLLYGGGLLSDHGRITSEVALAGFMGYLDNGDRPLELRVALGMRQGDSGEWRLGLWHGLNDRPWTMLSLTFAHLFDGPDR